MRKLVLLALLLALVGCKKPSAQVSVNTPPNQPQPGTQNQPNNNLPNVHAPTGVVTNPNTGGGGGGAAQAVRKAIGRAATQNDMSQLHLYINTVSSASENGRMPTPQQLATDLQKGAPNLYKLWADKVIAVTKMPQRESIWAYTVEPVSTAGYHLVINNNGVERMDTQALTQKLKQQGEL
jgi:hypothetical protein